MLGQIGTVSMTLMILTSHGKYGNITAIIDNMCAMRSFRVKEKIEVCLTHEALEAIRDKDKALQKAEKSGLNVDWDMARLLNKVGRDLENLRADYLKNQQETHRIDPKKF